MLAAQPVHAAPGTTRARRLAVRSGERILTCFFIARADAQRAVARLITEGVPGDAIRVLPKRVDHRDDIGVRAASKSAGGAAVGAIAGGAIGAAAGAITSAGALVIPDLGAVLAGPLVAALAGAGALGALGLAVGALAGVRSHAYEVVYLEDAVRAGGSLIVVRCARERAPRLCELLEASGARRVTVARPT